MKTLRFAVIGCGGWGPHFLRTFSEFDQVDLVGVCDLHPGRLSRVKMRYPALETTQDAHHLLARRDIDAVVIATPASTHFELAQRALETNKHVLVEKPMATSISEAETLVELARQSQRTLMVDHTFVYTGAVRKMRQLIQQGRVGDLVFYDSVRAGPGPSQADVNVLWDLGPHEFSIVDYLFSQPPAFVSAVESSRDPSGLEDAADIHLFFPDESMVHCHLSWLSDRKVRQTFLRGARGTLFYDGLDPGRGMWIYADADRGEAAWDRFSYADREEPLKWVSREFVIAVSGGGVPLTDGSSGARVTRWLAAAQQSLRMGGRKIPL